MDIMSLLGGASSAVGLGQQLASLFGGGGDARMSDMYQQSSVSQQFNRIQRTEGPAESVIGLRAAGLNPILAASNASSISGTGMVSATSGNPRNAGSNVAGQIAQLKNASSAAALNERLASKADADAAYSRSLTESEDLRRDIGIYEAQLDNILQNTNSAAQNEENAREQLKVIQQTSSNLISEGERLLSQIKLIEESINTEKSKQAFNYAGALNQDALAGANRFDGLVRSHEAKIAAFRAKLLEVGMPAAELDSYLNSSGWYRFVDKMLPLIQSAISPAVFNGTRR